MKAVPVLLCLALAHGITASIFNQQGRQVDDLDVQQYIEQYNQQHRNQPSTAQRDRRQQQLVDQQQQQKQQQQQQQQQQQRDQEQQQRSQESQQYQQGVQQQNQWEQPQQTQDVQAQQSQQYQQYQQPEYRRVQYQQSQEQGQYTTHKHSHHKHAHHNHEPHYHASSSSSESSQSSQESHERRNRHEQPTSHTHHQQWKNSGNQKVQVNDEVIEWNGLKMAVGPHALIQNKEDIQKIFGEAEKAMQHISKEDQVKFHQAYELAKDQENEDAELNATQLAQKYQYPVEEHTVNTDDGYVLTLFRIPPMKHIRDVQKKPVVFLMHGIDGSADDWLLMGPQKSLAYLLSDAGYDVWLGNARGNKYSRQHVSKHPAVADFWQFSTDEIALHDLPAMIDYALETTQQEKLYYIGHSQGTTAFFALTATRPEYNDKIIMMYALAPMVYMNNVRSPLIRMIAPTSQSSQRLQQKLGNGAFTPNKELIHAVGGDLLEKAIGCKKMASHVNFVMAGADVEGLDSKTFSTVMRHLPAGTSTKVIKQYGQGVASQEFRRYDYGAKINQKVYGTEQPPKYEMENVQAPVTLYYSEEDWLAHPQDVERLQMVLPNVRESNKVADQHFSHMDFQISTKAPEMVYRRLIESMQENQ